MTAEIINFRGYREAAIWRELAPFSVASLSVITSGAQLVHGFDPLTPRIIARDHHGASIDLPCEILKSLESVYRVKLDISPNLN